MVELDLVGLFFTVVLIGPRYFFHVLFACFVYEIGRMIATIALQCQVQEVIAGGMFGVTILGQAMPVLHIGLVMMAGPFCVLITGLCTGRLGLERKWDFFNPFIRLDNPLGVICLRLSLVSGLINAWYLVRVIWF